MFHRLLIPRLHRLDKRACCLFALLLLVGLGLRIWILGSEFGLADSDEAVVGLMAESFLDGDITPYFWGQNYGGTQETFLVAVLFGVFGSSVYALKAASLLCGVIACALLFALAQKLSDTKTALYASGLFWIAPWAFVWMSTKERGFYGVTMICGLTVLLAATHLEGPRRNLVVAVGGFAAGLGVWASPQIAYFLIPTAIWVIARRCLTLEQYAIAAGGLVAGALPAIVVNVRTGGRSLDVPDAANGTSYLDRLGGFFTDGLPTIVGLRAPYSREWIFGTAGVVAFIGLLALTALGCWIARRKLTGNHRLLVVFIATYPFVFAISPFSAYVAEPRYLYFLWPVLAIVVITIAEHFRFARRIAISGAAALTVATMLHLGSWDSKRSQYDLAAPDTRSTQAALSRSDDIEVFADYWISYALTFNSRGAVSATPIRGNRNEAIDDAARRAPKSTYVVFADSPDDDAIRRGASSAGRTFTEERVDSIVIFRFDSRILPEELKLSVTNSPYSSH